MTCTPDDDEDLREMSDAALVFTAKTVANLLDLTKTDPSHPNTINLLRELAKRLASRVNA